MLINKFGVAKPLILNVNGIEEEYTVPSGKSYKLGDIVLNNDGYVKGVVLIGGGAGSTITIIVPDGATGSGGGEGGDSGGTCTHSSTSVRYSQLDANYHNYTVYCTSCGQTLGGGTQQHTADPYNCTPRPDKTGCELYCKLCGALLNSFGHTAGVKCQHCGTTL